jgi:hypothetical protein
MATPSPAAPAASPKTAAQAIEHLNSVIVAVQAFAGKPQMNPYIYINEKLAPALVAVQQKDVKQEVIDAAFKLTPSVENFTFKTEGDSAAQSGNTAYVQLRSLGNNTPKPVDPNA